MNWIVENPWPVIAVGVVVELALVVRLFQTGRLNLVVWMLVVAGLAGGYWLLEERIVTDREQIETNLFEVAAAFERNDVATVEKYISKSAPVTLTEAQQAARLPFAEVRINNDLEVTVKAEADPPQAEATGTVTVVMASGFKGATPVRVKVWLRKVDGEWLIYSHEQPRVGVR